MIGLFSILPLAGSIGNMAQITKHVTSTATSVAAGFQAVGVGIGAIMLLIVTLYYITSILDGGKFQLKMLWPLLLFILVCNFNWVSTPVTAFTEEMTQGLVGACNAKASSIKAKNNCSDGANISDLNNARMNSSGEDPELVKDLIGSDSAKGKDVNKDGTFEDKGFGGGKAIGRGVKRGSLNMLRQESYNFQKESSGEKYVDPDEDGRHLNSKNITFSSIICAIISFVCQIMSKVLSAFGAVMTGIIIAFGPITWAFAVFPGQGRNVLSWFLRLCQFALWAPIVALVDTFSLAIFDFMADNTFTAGGMAMAICVAVCNLLALTSVPSIASMIIEGAQGAVSLSQGLQTISAGMTAAGGAIAGGAAAAKGGAALALGTDKVQGIKDAVAGAKQGGVIGVMRDIRQSDGLKNLAKNWQAAGRRARTGGN